MEIIEKFIFEKTGNADICEDGMVIGDKLIAVVDGATAKGKKLFNGKQSGAFAREVLCEVLSQKEDGTYYETRCILKATVLVNDEKIDVFVTHFGLADVEKKNMMDTLTTELSKSENRKILMGDFNCTPDDEYMKTLGNILNNIEPEKVTEDFYTYASYKPDRKIDYIMVDKSFKVGEFGVINSKASDYRPYFAEIEM